MTSEEEDGDARSQRRRTKKKKKPNEAVRAFARAYAASEGVVEDEAVVKHVHALRRALLTGVAAAPAAEWSKAVKAYAARLVAWVREGCGGAVGQVVSLRSAQKVASECEDAATLVKVVAALCESPRLHAETLAVLGTECSDDAAVLAVLRGAKKAALRENASSSGHFDGTRLVLASVRHVPPSAAKVLVDAWLALLSSLSSSSDDASLVTLVRHVEKEVLPRANAPLRFADFFVGLARHRDARVAVPALEALFFLTAHHGLEYASLYDDLLNALRDSPEVVLQNDDFLRLVSQALASTYATLKIRMAFAEALALAACRASPRGVVALLRVLARLLRRCPEAKARVRPRLVALTTHYLPAVSALAADLLDNDEDAAFEKEDVPLDAFTYAHLYAAQPKVAALTNGRGQSLLLQKDDDDDRDDSKKRPFFAARPGANGGATTTLQDELPFLAKSCVDLVLQEKTSKKRKKAR